MDITIQDKEVEFTKENAKAEFSKGNYPLAKAIFETLWNNSNKDDAYLLYDYGRALRKEKENSKFIEICNGLNDKQDIINNKWIISILCWCIYDSYIKNYSVDNKEDFYDFIKKAEYIKNNCEQLNTNEHCKNPYVLTIRKVVKIYNERASKNYKEIIKWLSYLDPDKLSEDVFSFQDENGKDREMASLKEFYYQHMAKAFEKTEKYEDCVKICETAFQQINRFHYRNNTWLKARMYFSKCMLQESQEHLENAIGEYKELAYNEDYWFMYHKLSQICFRYNKAKEALQYASKAFCCRFEYEKMVNLMSDTALLWQAAGDNSKAKLFFQASAFYRKRQAWSFSEELQFAISTLEIDIEEKPNIKVLQSISADYVKAIEGKNKRLEGKIDNILTHGKSGFIKPNNGGPNIYFNMKDVIGRKTLVKEDRVEYELIKYEDEKTRAIKIEVRG